MMLGYLLARAGVEVVVLEKHADFLRDFRGDTVHPSTLQVMHQLGLLPDFLKLPHDEVAELSGEIGDDVIHIADFSHLNTAAKFIALMPQWDFLNFLAEKARIYPEFRLILPAEVLDLVREDERVSGVKVRTPEGDLTVNADLVVGADGRGSIVRDRAGLEVEDQGSPMDVLWLRLPRHPEDHGSPLGRFVRGQIFVMIPRGDYFQCAYVIPKGGADDIRAEGLEAFKRSIAETAPLLKDRMDGLTSWDEVKLLTVTVDRLKTWQLPGLLCIGDAAHAMSPIGGIGINLAIQDAVATANLLSGPLRAGKLTLADLQSVQRRREWPTKVTQAAQVFAQNRIIAPTLKGGSPKAPWILKLLNAFPYLRRFPAQAVGMGVRFEAVRSPDVHAA